MALRQLGRVELYGDWKGCFSRQFMSHEDFRAQLIELIISTTVSVGEEGEKYTVISLPEQGEVIRIKKFYE